jgi:hypothetical protein
MEEYLDCTRTVYAVFDITLKQFSTTISIKQKISTTEKTTA